jgi:hypothetical protein
MKALGEVLRKEMHEGDEETRRLMRVLHEEVIALCLQPCSVAPVQIVAQPLLQLPKIDLMHRP